MGGVGMMTARQIQVAAYNAAHRKSITDQDPRAGVIYLQDAAGNQSPLLTLDEMGIEFPELTPGETERWRALIDRIATPIEGTIAGYFNDVPRLPKELEN